MFCYNCGQQMEEETIFCSSCGTKQEDGISQESTITIDSPKTDPPKVVVKPVTVLQPSTQIPGIGTYILAIFLTPIYFFTRGKIVPGIITTILYLLSIPLMFLFFMGLFFWGFAAVWGGWSLRCEMLEAHARRTGEETARALLAAQRQG